MLEGVAERRPFRQQRADAAAEVARRGNAEQLTEPATRTAVVGDSDHSRELGGVLPSRFECLGEPVTAADRNHLRSTAGGLLAHRSMSR